MHRRRYQLDLVRQTGAAGGEQHEAAVGRRIEPAAPMAWSDSDAEHTSNQLRLEALVLIANDDHLGHGRTGYLEARVGLDGKFTPRGEGASCTGTFGRTDFKAGDGIFEDDSQPQEGGDEGSSSPSTRADPAAARAQRACVSQCRESAGECRTSCGGGKGSARCVNDCGKEERACKSGC